MKKALISVANKENLEVILKKLTEDGYHFISTGTTAKKIEELGYEVQKVADVINFEEILGGRVKTLHPNIHGGILSRRTVIDREELNQYDIEEIDIVICNLYPFEETINKKDTLYTEAIEKIDIGGVTLLRAAAKNNEHVCVLCDPNDYATFSLDKKLEYAVKAFEHTAYYDVLIANYLKEQLNNAKKSLTIEEQLKVAKENKTSNLLIGARPKIVLRYGENAHQQATYYETNENLSYSLKNSEILSGKELSYNNIKDIDAALNLISEFKEPTVVALKHNVPCGVGFGITLSAAYDACLEMDDVSIFGGIVAVNNTLTLELANKLNKLFLEVVIAPQFEEAALTKLKEKKNLRILKTKMDSKPTVKEIISVNGGFLVQQKDQNNILEEVVNIVTNNQSNEEAFNMALKAQIVCKYVKSNAIVIATKDKIIAQGGGQTSRIDAAQIALDKAQAKGYTQDLILASDAFFPFADGIILAHKYGVKTIIQPGGSIKDEEVIKKCDELGIVMGLTGIRHFKH